MIGVTAAVIAIFVALIFVTLKGRDPKPNAKLTPETRATRSIRWVIVLAWGASTLPSLVHNLTTSRRANAVVEVASYSTLTSMVAYGTAIALTLYCLAQIMTSKVVTDGHRFVGVSLVLLPWVLAIGSSVINRTNIPYHAIALPIMAVALWRLNAKIRDLVPVAWLTGLTSVIALTMGAVLPSLGLLHGSSGEVSTADKAIIGDTLLAGPFNHSNQLGVILALGLPAVFLLRNRKISVWITLATVVALAWSASRGSLAAVGVMLLGVLLVSRVKSAPARRSWASLCIIPCAAIVVYIPLTTEALNAYSFRGQIWLASLGAWSESPTFGNGYGWFGEIGRVRNSLTAVAFNGHNLFVHSLVTGGVVLLIALALLSVRLLAVARAQASEGQFFGMAYAMTFFVIAALEVPTRFRDVDPLSWVALVPLLVISMQTAAKKPTPTTRVSITSPQPVNVR